MLDPAIAQTQLGDLRGVRGGGVTQFRGVPYAEPPVGRLRFQPPQPAGAWPGVRDATGHGPIAPQPSSRLAHLMGDPVRPQGEDCLTLTISTPAAGPGSRPVLVWLHGGAFLTGAGSLDWYDGTTLAAEGGAVVVGVNYRLGALGYLCHPAAGDGTAGVRDVIAALRWVRTHIGAFGGDPDRVTLAGQSAGAAMIAYLLALEDGRGLFRRAILQSAPAGRPPLTSDAARERADHLLDLLGIDRSDPDHVAERLRAVPAADLVDATARLARATAAFGRIAPPLFPVFDALDTSRELIAAAARGALAAGVELVIGTTRDEAMAFLTVPGAAEPDPALVADRFAELAGSAASLDRYRALHPGARPVDLVSDLLTDHTFLLDSLRLAEQVSGGGGRAWVYQFDWAPAGSPFGACHCIELPFVFGSLPAWRDAAMLRGADAAAVADLSATVRAAWLAFAQTGDPSAAVPWPPYAEPDRRTMVFGSTVGPVGDPAGLAWRPDFVSARQE